MSQAEASIGRLTASSRSTLTDRYLWSAVEDVGRDGEGTNHKALDIGRHMVNMVVMVVVGRLGRAGLSGGGGHGHRGRTLHHMDHFAINICNDTGTRKSQCTHDLQSKYIHTYIT